MYIWLILATSSLPWYVQDWFKLVQYKQEGGRRANMLFESVTTSQTRWKLAVANITHRHSEDVEIRPQQLTKRSNQARCRNYQDTDTTAVFC